MTFNFKRTKIIFESTVLVWAENNSLCKTGVHRAVNSILKNFYKNPEIELILTADNNYINRRHAEAYFRRRGLYRIYWPFVYFVKFWTRPLWNLFNFLFHKHIYFSTFLPVRQSVSKGSRFKTVLLVYDLIAIKFPGWVDTHHKSLCEEIMNSINKDTLILCISENTKKDLLEYRPDLNENKIYIIPLAATEEFRPIPLETAKDFVIERFKVTSPYILSVATIEPRKNLKTAVEAFLQFKKKNPTSDLKFILVGSIGWGDSELETLIHQNTDIQCLGYVPDYALTQLYSAAKAFIYLSMYEGFGLPPLEAMKCGIPVISSNSSSLPEVVGNAGILVNPTDFNSAALAIETLVYNESEWKRLSHLSLARAKEFTWERSCHKILQVVLND